MSGDSNEHMSMVMRKAAGTEVISSDIALRLAELIFVRHYGKDVTDAQLPLTITDHKDRWEVKGDKVEIPGQRVKVVIMKADGRIVELYGW